MSGVRYILEAVDLVTGPMAKVDKAFDKTAAKYDKLDGKSQRLRDEQGRFVASTKSTASAVDGLGSKLMKLGTIGAGIGAALSVTALVNYGKAAISTAAKFEKMQAVLSNKLGSQFAGEQSMGMLKEFAKVTPYSVEELTASYMKLVSQGFKPTMAEMRSMGDLASSMGKPFDQLAEAVLDAQTGEFERLKEFGIKARAEGDKIALTFSGQTTVIDKGAEAMRKYLVSLGDAKGVMGSMAVISKTVEGMESNLEDAWTSLSATVGERLTPAYKDLLTTGTSVAGWLEELVKIPVEKKIEAEIEQIEILGGALMNPNLLEAERLDLLKKLNEINPNLVDGINAESVSYSKLAENIKKVTDALYAKRALSTLEKDFEDVLAERDSKAAYAGVKRVNIEKSLRKFYPGINMQQLDFGAKLDNASFQYKKEEQDFYNKNPDKKGRVEFDREKRLFMAEIETYKAMTAGVDKIEKGDKWQEFLAVKGQLEKDSFLANNIANPKAESITPTNGNNTGVGPCAGGGGKSGSKNVATSTANSIASGGVRPTTINMTFHKLQDQIVIHTTNLQTGSKQAGEMVVEEILRALNGANAALAAQ